jgi:DNA modification methylase
MPISFRQQPKLPAVIIHVEDDADDVVIPRHAQPLPLDQRIRVDARIKAECVEIVAIEDLKPNARNAKKHPDRQIAILQENFEHIGFTNPIHVDENNKILAGHARYLAARRSGFDHLPVIRHAHLSAAKKRAFAIADNKIAELGEWDMDVLAEELSYLFDPQTDLSFDPRSIGFETVELDQIIVGDDNDADRADLADEPILASTGPAVTQPGDIWCCGEHRLICGDATNMEDYIALLGMDMAQMVFTDPPYNVPNAGHVTGRDGVREFAMAHGEMTSEEFVAFLSLVFANTLGVMVDGAVAYFCMDWRHLPELWAAAEPMLGKPKNLICWVKTNAGMGSFYRSQHEMISVHAAPGKSINNFGLGGKGRHRSNVWKYPGFSSFGRGRDKALAMHPTVKPVAMVADALMDCSNRGGIVLDPFAGSGTTMIAAERTGRRARLIEIDPVYCDVTVERWQTFSCKTARLAETNETYDEVKSRRGAGIQRGGLS